jgi:hypothetical protein
VSAAIDKQLDWLVVTVTPTIVRALATSRAVEREPEQRRPVVPHAFVCTGDESSTALTTDEMSVLLERPVIARIPQLWGRAEPNLGFGPALAIPELDRAVHKLIDSLIDAHLDTPTPEPSTQSWATPNVTEIGPRIKARDEARSRTSHPTFTGRRWN